MTTASRSKDLIVLTADPTMRRTIEVLMEHRRPSLGIGPVSVDFQTHRHRDSGCRSTPGEVINPIRNQYNKAMVVFDFHGCGERRRTAAQLETDLEQELQGAAWGSDGIAVVTIEPELEAWLFGASFRRLELLVGWSQEQPMRGWLETHGHLELGTVKPNDPQAAFDHILELQRKRRSSSLFADLARTIGLARCQDRAFQKFRSTLQRWFPAE